MKSLGLQKSQFLNPLVNWEKSGSATEAILKKIIFLFNWEKLNNIQTRKNVFVNWEKPENVA